jgi:hypothetical protein
MPQQHSWTQYTPVAIAPDTPIPRVAAYVSKACPGIRVTQRSDLVTHRDILILEISLSPNLSFLVINIYNDSKSTALDVLITLPLPSLPTILSGDFNLHHGLWSVNDRPPPTSPKTEALLEWTDNNRFNLINKAGEVTFFRTTVRSVLDLTWANDRALKSGLLDEWQVREAAVVSTLCVKFVGAMTTPDIYFMGTLVGKYLSVNLCIGPQRPLGIFPGYLGDPPDGG